MDKRMKILVTLCLGAVSLGAESHNEAPMLQAARRVLPGNRPIECVMNNAQMAVYRQQDGGFAVVEASGQVPRVLAYSPTSQLDVNDRNPGFNWWLKAAQRRLQTPEPRPKITKPDTTRFSQRIDALTTTLWGQREPFKFMCPFVNYVEDWSLYGTYQPDSAHFVVGCGPTAMAQYMYYYKFPRHGVGQDSVVVKYDVPGQGTVGVTYRVDFEQGQYDLDNMINDYQGDYTDQQGEAVARLCYHCGVAARSTYNNLGSGTNDARILDAFIQHFNYNDTAHYIVRSRYDEPTWMEMVYSELTNHRPIFYSGKDINLELGIFGGHNFIIDGYDEEGMVHVNWGWYGLENGYFDIALLNPQLYTYDDWQAMYVGLYPNRETLVGDINDDGQVDVSDINAIINMMLGKATQTNAADINGDGNVDVSDVNAVINIMLGKISK